MFERIRTQAERALAEFRVRATAAARPSGVLPEGSSSIFVDAPPSVVCKTISDPAKPFATGSPFVDMTTGDDRTRRAGTVYRWTFDVPFGESLSLEAVVTEWEENARFAYRATSGWPMEAVNTLEPEGDGTRRTSTFRYRLPDPWRWLLPRRAVVFGVRHILRTIRRYAEAEHRGRDRSTITLIEFSADIDAPPAEVVRVVDSIQFHETADDCQFRPQSLRSRDSAVYAADDEGLDEYYCGLQGADTCRVILVGDVSLPDHVRVKKA